MSDPLARAKDPKTSPSDLDRLAQHSDVAVVRTVAKNQATSASTLSRLAAHPDTKVRVSVAWHQNTSIETTVALALAPNAGFEIYEGPLEPGWFDSIHGRIVWRMMSHPEPALLDALSEVPSVPGALQNTAGGQLITDVVGAARRLRTFHDVERVRGLSVTRRIEYLNRRGRPGMGISCISRACLAILAIDTDVSVRVAVARSNKTTPQIRHLLADDPALEVRREVARHPQTPQDVALALWKPDGYMHGDIEN